MYRSNIELHNMDCMEYMKTCEDDQFDLAIVDPPYGMARKMDGSSGGGRVMNKFKRQNSWDIAPSKEYFIELKRISKEYIIWGANNFINHLSPTTNYIFWYKHQPVSNFADGELAFTLFDGVAKCYSYRYFGSHGIDTGGKIHPTQKPVALYKWILNNYANEGDKIFDSHLGSGYIAIACDEMGFDLVGCELDKEYYDSAVKRLEPYRNQMDMF